MSEQHWATNLEELMAALRDPTTGCPWDLKQNWNSLTKHTLEEVYECIDAIEQNESEHVKEELGDLLFHVYFYAQIAKENKLFSIEDIAKDLNTKMRERHPHVFSNATFESVDQHLKEWELRKMKNRQTVMDDIPNALPALIRAQKTQKKVSVFGFDWPNVTGPLNKCHEELAEITTELNTVDNQDKLEEEIGDLLFSVVNLARHCKIDAEMALKAATNKFIDRFKTVEKNSASAGKPLAEHTIEELESLWATAKKS